MLRFVHRITKYDPADRDERGSYIGTEDSTSDHGPVEAAYLQAVDAFAEAAGIDHLVVREPQIGPAWFGREQAVPGHGLDGLFPPDLSGFHDGAEVSVRVGLELVRAMLRDNGAWCRLEVEDVFAVHVGWDQYVYVGSDRPCPEALAQTRTLGLFPERLDASPYDAAHDEEAGVQRPADDDFWARLRLPFAGRQAAILEEGYVDNASRWHRLTEETLDAVRARLTPRAKLTVWPDLCADVGAVLAALPEEGPVEVVWEDEDGSITSTIADETEYRALAARVAGARAAAAWPLYVDARHPLCTAVVPDRDGVLRARWRTEPTPGDRCWAFLKTLRRGQTVTGVVTAIADFGVTFVDIGGFTAMINVPELSWRPIDHPSDIVTVGKKVSAEVLDVDMVRERVPLSLRALQEDPLTQFARRVGQVVTGVVVRLVPFGALVRIEERKDGFVGLVHNSELSEEPVAGPGEVVRVGDPLVVKILQVDLTWRRITLSHLQVHAPGGS
ncbi:S1 RNA-binding domain-containing protein [Streptomyces sp. NPDC020800]|uniref:S1 RNA-binding domain-containing protein n=1 Tax=Streptomyces sp. NPDC020800 TaxID=3365092 RepID=UPI0037B82F4D